MQQLSALLAVPGVELVGPLPESLQNTTQISAGIFTLAKELAAAQALLDLMTSPEGSKIFHAKGMIPER